MIGGIIVLALFLTALSAMVLVSQQNDTYQSLAAKMSQKDINRFSENLVAVYPGLVGPAVVSGTNQYSMTINNVGGIGTQIVRIYINSTGSSGCLNPCILNPAKSATANGFSQADSFLNPGESTHTVTMWLPSSINLPTGYSANTVWIITARGRIFSFKWPFPPAGVAVSSSGSNSFNIGPLVVKFEPILITYTTSTVTVPPIPINAGWLIPTQVSIILFIKIANQGFSDVTITTASTLQTAKFSSPGNPTSFWLVAPMSTSLCQNTFQANPRTANVTCSSSYAGGNTFPSGTNLVPYDGTNHPYIIPKPTQLGLCCGAPVYLLFAATAVGGNAYQSLGPSYTGSVFSYMLLTFIYDDGSGSYTYGVNLPFIQFCGGTTLSSCQP